MNNKILVFNKKACEEYNIPFVSVGKYQFRIEKGQFDLEKDLVISMQVLDDSWCFSESREYNILRGKEQFFLKRINIGDIFSVSIKNGDEFFFVVEKQASDIPVYRKYLLNKKKEVLIGSSNECDITICSNKMVSRQHARLEYVKEGWMLRNLKANGTYVNHQRIMDTQMLEYGDEINLFGIHLVYLKDVIAVGDEESQVQVNTEKLNVLDNESEKWLSMLPVYTDDTVGSIKEFKPAPRTMAEYDEEEFEIEAPPQPKQQKQKSLFMTLGPSVTMAVPMLLGVILTGVGALGIGLITMVGAAVIGAFWAYMNRKAQDKKMIEDEEERCRRYKEYLVRKEAELKEKYEFNVQERCSLYPSSEDCLIFDEHSAGLWNRNVNQEDYLYVRLGLGEMPLPKKIKIPQERFTMIDDSLAEEPARIKDAYEKMKNVPVGINLEQHTLVGLIGGKEYEGIYQILKPLIVQTAAAFSYTEMKIVLLCDKKRPGDRKILEDTKWLPHMWNEEKTFRYAGDSKESIGEVLNVLIPELRHRREVSGANKDGDLKKKYNPWILFLVTAPYLLEENLSSVYLFDSNHPIGTTTVLCTESYEDLPNACEYMLQNTEEFQGCYSVKEAKKNWETITFDQVRGTKLKQFAHQLAALQIKSPEARQDIPSMITFLDMYGVNNAQELEISRRWNTSRSYEALRVPVGMREGNMYCFLDIHENAHGPHGLVAGTTGSGKSEMLQTWILSLAVNFSPEDIAIFIIDFKGGGMANQFVRLPHLAGNITNLGGNQIYRALVTIRSENQRRQRKFLEAGVKDIYEYTRLYKNHELTEAIPHLLIIVDEFAELKKERPEFMDELISVAAIGRSLGVHLILATQKPAGTVDNKIESNSRFRICLKVQDKQDSNDMLKRPDAAFITQTGRGYLRVGTDEIFELFQAAWSGAVYQADYSQNHDELAKLYTVNGRTEIIGTHQKMLRKEKERIEWADRLIQMVQEVLKDTGVELREYLQNPEVLKQVNEAVYKYYMNEEWNIVPSAYNDARILDLMTVLETCQKKNGKDVTADEVLKTAMQTRRTLPEAGKKTQLAAVIDTIQNIAESTGMAIKNSLWLPELPSKLLLEKAGSYAAEKEVFGLEAVVGKYDDPEHQFQSAVTWDIVNQGNFAVYGTISSGKSTFLQTYIYALILRYSAEQVNIYGIDFSSRMLECFKEAPQVGGIISGQQMDQLGKFFYMIKQILEERKQQLKGGNFDQYRRAGGDDIPAIVIVIDQYGSFREKTDGSYDAQMLELLKEGNGNGIYIVLSAGGQGSTEIPGKHAENLRGSFCLQLNDTFQYKELLKGKPSVFPEEGIRGRGLLNLHGSLLEFQTALAVDAENDYKRNEKIAHCCRILKDNWTGPEARHIPVIPENPTFSEFAKLPEVKKLLEDDRSFPLGYSMRSASVWSLDFSRFYCYLVSGKKRTGKTNFLQMAMRMAALKGGKSYVFANGYGILEKTAEETGAAYYSVEDDLEPFCAEIRPYLAGRNKKKHELEYKGYNDEEIYLEMCKEENIYLFIDDLPALLDNLYHPKEGRKKADKFFETFADKGWYHQIFIFAGFNPDDRPAMAGNGFYEYVSRDKNGIYFGGNVEGQSVLNFDYMGFKEKKKAEPVGIGTLAIGEGRMPVGKVMIPDARK